MTLYGYALILLSFLVSIGDAQAQNENLDIVKDPICFRVINKAPYSVYGGFSTDYFIRPDGIKARHTSNFRLHAAGSIDEHTGKPSDREEFCSYGPFLPNRQLELTLRTLFPIFACKTRIDRGEIIIQGRRKDEGGTETWVECFN